MISAFPLHCQISQDLQLPHETKENLKPNLTFFSSSKFVLFCAIHESVELFRDMNYFLSFRMDLAKSLHHD